MNIKSLFVFLLVVAAVVWVSLGDDAKQQEKPQSLTAGQQQQMQKAANLEQDMQKQLDERMRAAPSEQ